MGHHRGCGRGTIGALAAAMCLAALSPCWGAQGDVAGRQVVVSIELPQAGRALDAAVARAAELGARGVLWMLPPKEGPEQVRELLARTRPRGLELWIGLRSPADLPSDLAGALAGQEIAGLALVFPAPKGEVAKRGDLPRLLAVKRKGEELGQSVRRLKAALGRGRRLAICLSAPELAPETARGRFVPVRDLVRDGTVDVVCLSEAGRWNFHRLRLLRAAPLLAGMFADARILAPTRRVGFVSRGAIDAIGNDTCECLWVSGLPAGPACETVAAAVEGHKRAQAERQAIDRALADGDLVVEQQVSEKGCDDQATVHGVAQSFVPSRDGRCPLVQIYAALRGCGGALPPPLAVELRADDGGKPADTPLAKAMAPACDFGHEPAYRWGSAHFDPPVRLAKGTRYWLTLPAARHPEGTYVWRIVKDGATASRRAWSSRYDYSKHAWVFRVYLSKERSR